MMKEAPNAVNRGRIKKFLGAFRGWMRFLTMGAGFYARKPEPGGRLDPASDASPHSREFDGTSTPEETIIQAKDGVRFEPNPVFGESLSGQNVVTINEGPCRTQLSSNDSQEVQLIIGLDLGTAFSKVVIGDPDNKRFFAVPFSFDPSNKYLIPTAILKDADNNLMISTGEDRNIVRSIKLSLMHEETRPTIIHVAGYIAQIVRYSMRWFLDSHADEYRDMAIFWTMTLGLPADSARQQGLESRFRLAAIMGAQAAISGEQTINIENLADLLDQVKRDLENQANGNTPSCFKELGGDEGVVTVVPEIAAQVIGFRRSRRWDSKYPISFLMDVGAGTVDAAVFSIMDDQHGDKDFVFSALSCSVSELGVMNLHLDRINWLIKNLPEDLPNKQEIAGFLVGVKHIDGTSIRVPDSIDEYINAIEIVKGKKNKETDRAYLSRLIDNVYDGVLMKARKKNPLDTTWGNLRTMICGGGARFSLYKKYVQNITNSSAAINLWVERLEKPENLDAPGLSNAEYDRLSVAYGLAQYTQWGYAWPGDIGRVEHENTDFRDNYVSKDDV